MKYLKYNLLLVIALAFNVVLWGQEPCKDLKVKVKEAVEIKVPTLITPTNEQKANALLNLLLQCPDEIRIIINKSDNDNDNVIGQWEISAGTTCSPNDVTITQTSGVSSGDVLTEGTYPVAYKATDLCDNTATCQFNVVVSYYKPIIAFIHGLDGDNSSWSKASAYTEENFNAYEVQIDYNPDDGLEAAGESLNDLLISNINQHMTSLHQYSPSTNVKENRKANFIIAHSQGGIVTQYGEMYAREHNEWKNYGIYYGGLVTFGSSNKGAYILNSLIEDNAGNVVYDDDDPDTQTRFQNFSKKATKALTAGEIKDIKYDAVPWWLRVFGLDRKLEDAVNNFVDLLADKVPKIVVDGSINATTLGYIVNPTSTQSVTALATYFDGDGSSVPDLEEAIPKIAFYGVVDNEETQGELIWRTAFWARNGPNAFPIDNPVFGGASSSLKAGEDGQNAINKFRNEYFSRECEAQEHGDWHHNHISWNMYGKAEKWYERADAWRQGRIWFDTANNQYKTLIGATTYQVANDCSCKCTKEYFAYDDPNEPDPTIESLDDCNDSCEQFESEGTDANGEEWEVTCVKNTDFSSFVKESDGLVLAESASYIAGATVNETSQRPNGQGDFTKDDFVLYGSIHMQMRNDMNMKEKLEGVYDSDTHEWEKGLYRGYYHDHFKID